MCLFVWSVLGYWCLGCKLKFVCSEKVGSWEFVVGM